mmetsp:Transcript_38235/g.68933  ORF Transcript_38235/g.68933 Transcript_38235/m.68933 type:complete len:223 (+) Transcript_38235:601-1269(+)|eukprot:CAMPEP_0201904016 /NCGR_PEP_ID=MMETSP0902-20130614/55780_1 /ASSEMBLY_ACC=CAM_ASM_000551 /TAXON_ID=420261 /ORGANISM="Thalassiosira antarctica, Strain CCMP982" /LENGTH=222 /DNA_ID=CAMNT_0048438085 /DNA_START=903 /DNA_END=1571 /DNA_ORIENTATION=+
MKNAKPGHNVEFKGLKGAAHLNGTRGHLIEFLKKEQRWAVRCDGGNNEVVKAKTENLTILNRNSEAASMPNIQQQLAPPDHDASASRSITSSSHSDDRSLSKTVIESYYQRRMGGAVVFHGSSYMLAVEFNAPAQHGSSRAISSDMVYVDKSPQARAVVRGRRCNNAKDLGTAFLRGETIEYIEATTENAFFDLLSRYKSGSETKGLIDMGSGLKMHSVTLM